MKHYFYRSTPLIAFLVYGGCYALWSLGYQRLYQALLTAWGIVPFRFPFLDVSAILAARECAEKGINVFVVNPCDVLARPHVYSPLWLIGHGLAAASADTPSAGVVLDLAFLAALWLLPQPKTGVAFIATLAATLSTMTLYAVERANNDIVIFLIVIAAARLTAHPRFSRFFGYGGFFVAALLKFYPAVLVVMTLRERFPLALLTSAAFIAGGALFVAYYWQDLSYLVTHFPQGSPFTDLFASRNLPAGISQMLALPPAGDMAGHALPTLVFAFLLFLWARVAQQTMHAIDLPADFGDVPDGGRQIFLAGLLLLLGCFFAGQSVGYRGVLFLLVLPALLRMAQTRPLYRATGLVTLLIMWEEPLRYAVRRIAQQLPEADGNRVIALFWVVRELTWWWLMGTFGGILAAILWDTPSIRALRRWTRRPGTAL